MTAAQFEGLRVDEAAEVLHGASTRSAGLGVRPRCGAVIAANVEIDLHDVVELVERGCPPELRRASCSDEPRRRKSTAADSDSGSPVGRRYVSPLRPRLAT